jgi:hypothetical protein
MGKKCNKRRHNGETKVIKMIRNIRIKRKTGRKKERKYI